MKKNKVLQIRESDIKKIKRETMSKAIDYATIIFLNVMRDSEGYGKHRLQRVYDAINDLSDSIAKGYCSLYDLEKVLKDEANIVVSGGKFDKRKV